MRYTFADLVAASKALEKIEAMRAELAQFAAAQQLGDDGVLEFLEIASGDAFSVPPTEALGYFRSRGLRPSFSYADAIGRADQDAFSIAKMVDVDLLGQVRNSLDAALADGVPFQAWRKEIEPVLKAAGWWGKSAMPDPITGQLVDAQLGSAWRLETIFRTNMQSAYAAGQWREIEEAAEFAPFLLYDAVDDHRTRPAHRAWDSVVLPVSSPWWRTHYPPNGWNCRCSVIQLDSDQLASMGLTPRTEPPDDGTFTFTNPRTGATSQVPNGVDPGFDRNPGNRGSSDLRTLLREKVATLPEDMQAAIAPVMPRQFDTSTAAGKWHAPSFRNAPTWLLNKVLDQQAVRVEMVASTAHAMAGSKIDMDGKAIDQAAGQSVWRHEFGHILDSRLATSAMYRSSQPDYLAAMKSDADSLTAAAGNGRKSRANDARRAEIVATYAAVPDRVLAVPQEGRTELLRNLARDAGLDFGAMLPLLRESTLILEEGAGGAVSLSNAIRIARMIEAVRLGDGEGFLRFASFMDLIDAEIKSGLVTRETRRLAMSSWRKDGTLAALSDLIGAATRNRAASYNDGFPGHSDSYYKNAALFSPTETFANLTALAGAPNSYWWTITQRLAPNMAALFRQIIEGEK